MLTHDIFYVVTDITVYALGSTNRDPMENEFSTSFWEVYPNGYPCFPTGFGFNSMRGIRIPERCTWFLHFSLDFSTYPDWMWLLSFWSVFGPTTMYKPDHIYIYILYIHIFSNPEIDRHVGNPGNKHIFSGIAWKHFSIFGCAIHIYDHIWECMLFIMHSIHLCRWYIYICIMYIYICACVMHFHM